MTQNEFAPITPGEMLKEEFLAEYGLSQNRLAKAIGISPNRIAEIVNNRRRITADTALRLGLYFGNSPEFWMNLQTHYDLKMARRNLKAADAKRIKARRAAGSPGRESSTLDGNSLEGSRRRAPFTASAPLQCTANYRTLWKHFGAHHGNLGTPQEITRPRAQARADRASRCGFGQAAHQARDGGFRSDRRRSRL